MCLDKLVIMRSKKFNYFSIVLFEEKIRGEERELSLIFKQMRRLQRAVIAQSV
jgi:hypothetical protein